MIATAPKPGTDTLIITHRPNILDALGKDWFEVKEGEASIFRPENGVAKLVGRVQMDDTPELLWDRPDLERLFARLRDEFEIIERFTALNRKLGLVSRTVETALGLN